MITLTYNKVLLTVITPLNSLIRISLSLSLDLAVSIELVSKQSHRGRAFNIIESTLCPTEGHSFSYVMVYEIANYTQSPGESAR